MTPDHVHSEAVVTDGKWHALGMIYEPRRVRLFVDGKQVANTAIEPAGIATEAGDFAIGSLATHEIGCNGFIDEVRLSRGVRELGSVPTAPLKADEQTIGLWHFDRIENQQLADESSLQNSAKIVSSR